MTHLDEELARSAELEAWLGRNADLAEDLQARARRSH